MTRTPLVGLTLFSLGCVPMRHAVVAPADTTEAKPHSDAFMALAVSALIVLVLIPVLVGQKP